MWRAAAAHGPRSLRACGSRAARENRAAPDANARGGGERRRRYFFFAASARFAKSEITAASVSGWSCITR